MTGQGFDIRDGILCKGCKTLHWFEDRDIQKYARPIIFPKGDFSLYHVICPHDETFYDYLESEVLRHETDSDEQVNALKDQVKALESRLAVIEGGKWMEERKQELEDFVRHALSKQVKDELKKTAVPYTT
jgi:hypothetical protein